MRRRWSVRSRPICACTDSRTANLTVPMREGLVLHVAVSHVTISIGAVAVDDLAPNLLQLRVRGRYGKSLEERFLRHLPVGWHADRLPPVVVHIADRQILDEGANRRDEFVEGLRVGIEVDEHEPRKHGHLHSPQRDVAVAQLAAAKLLPLEYELAVPGKVPAPTMKRAYDATAAEPAGALCERGTPMRTDVLG